MTSKLCLMISKLINSQDFLEKSRKSEKDFTRNRKVSFADMMKLILSCLGHSIQDRINDFIIESGIDFATYSKQAFSKGRQRIKPEAFTELLKATVDFIYKNADCKRFHGYRVLAVDGSKIDLPYNKKTMEIYGCQNGTNNSIQALASCLVDVMNNVFIDGLLAPCNGNERVLAKKHIESLIRVKTDKDIVVFDRGYPSTDLIKMLENANIKYVMRCSSTFISGFKNKISGNDCVITHKFRSTKTQLTMRVLKFPISKNTTETLITNIFDTEFTVDDFKMIYRMRWGIETNYDNIKNVFCLESFSGTLPEAVLQDFYATLFLYNVATVINMENSDKIDQKNVEGNNKYFYKANVKMAILTVKNTFIKALICKSKIRRTMMLTTAIKQLEKSLSPVREGRRYDRKIKHTQQKYPQNQKR